MKIFKSYSILLAVIFLMGSCNAVLDTEDQSAIDNDGLFEDRGLAELFLNYLYQPIMPGFNMLRNAGMSDDAIGGNAYGQSSSVYTVSEFMTGITIDPAAGTDKTPGNYSITTYGYLRNLQQFIEGVQNGPLDEIDKEELIGQARFLRAFLYWRLILFYGGVPIVDRVIDLNEGEESYILPRNSASECVGFIINDLDQSIALLENKDLEYGRITAAAAAAFKGRVLLFYASPQFNPNRDGEGLAVDADGIAARWQVAYDANLAAKNIAEGAGHGLHDSYADVFLDEDNQEAILINKYTVGLRTHGYENSVRPWSVANSYSGSGTPTWDFVKAFPMQDGRSIEDHPDYDSTEYWVGRDPRFYSVVAYNGAEWQFSGREATYQWTYQFNNQENGNIPQTGFFLRKNVNTDIARASTTQTPTDWIEIRFAEVLLNLAESANEIGNTSEALNILYDIRSRAGIDAGTGNYGITASSKADLREVIMNERRIELCFENQRHFDLRRRNLFVRGVDGSSNGLNGTRRKGILTKVDTAYIVQIEPGLSGSSEAAIRSYFEQNIRDTVDWSADGRLDEYFDYTLEYMDNETSALNYLQPKYNFFYLPTNATVRNDLLEQTINWQEGAFDPLAE